MKAWESSLVAGRHGFSQVYKYTSRQPSPKWQLPGTHLILTKYLLYLPDKDLSFKWNIPVSRGNVFFLISCIIFMHISQVVYAIQHEYFKVDFFFFPDHQDEFPAIVLSKNISLLLYFLSFFETGKLRMGWHIGLGTVQKSHYESTTIYE